MPMDEIDEERLRREEMEQAAFQQLVKDFIKRQEEREDDTRAALTEIRDMLRVQNGRVRTLEVRFAEERGRATGWMRVTSFVTSLIAAAVAAWAGIRSKSP